MSDEAIEWRVKNLDMSVGLLAGILCSFIATVSAALWIATADYAIGMLFFVNSLYWLLISLLVLINVRAGRTNGYCRALASKYYEFDDPPLDEWAESLEERGEFSTKDGRITAVSAIATETDD